MRSVEDKVRLNGLVQLARFFNNDLCYTTQEISDVLHLIGPSLEEGASDNKSTASTETLGLIPLDSNLTDTERQFLRAR